MIEERWMVIGSNSFSGVNFIDYLLSSNRAAKVVAVSRSPENPVVLLPYRRFPLDRVSFHQFDLNKATASIAKLAGDFGVDYIVNFAAQGMVAESWEHPEHWFKTNCISLMKLAECLVSGKIPLKRFVQISSPEVYGSSGGETEDKVSFQPSSPYAASKAAGDLSLYPYYINKGFPVVYTRATNVYGPHQQPYRIIPRAIIFIKEGKKIQLHGGGRAVKSYIHINDVCEATLRIARNGLSGEVYHISPDNGGISIHDLVAMICDRMGRNIAECVEVVGDRFGQDAAYIINSDKVRRELGWRPRIALGEGLDGVIDWVEEHYHDLVKIPQQYIHKA